MAHAACRPPPVRRFACRAAFRKRILGAAFWRGMRGRAVRPTRVLAGLFPGTAHGAGRSGRSGCWPVCSRARRTELDGQADPGVGRFVSRRGARWLFGQSVSRHGAPKQRPVRLGRIVLPVLCVYGCFPEAELHKALCGAAVVERVIDAVKRLVPLVAGEMRAVLHNGIGECLFRLQNRAG